jgi:hypothetical protein
MTSETIRDLMGTTRATKFCDEVLCGEAVNFFVVTPGYPKPIEKPSRRQSKQCNIICGLQRCTEMLEGKDFNFTKRPSPRSLHQLNDKNNASNSAVLPKRYKQWKKETEVMLEKDSGDPKIDQLQITHNLPLQSGL